MNHPGMHTPTGAHDRPGTWSRVRKHVRTVGNADQGAYLIAPSRYPSVDSLTAAFPPKT